MPRAGRGASYPASFAGYQYVSILVFGLLAATVVPAVVSSAYTENLVDNWLLYAIAAVGFFIIFGLGGQFAFSQAFMMGLGGYVSAWAAGSGSAWRGMLAAIVVVAAVAAVFALLALRTSQMYFAIATFGLSQIGVLVIQRWGALGGINGQRLGIAPTSWFGYNFVSQTSFYYLFLIFLVVGLLLAALLERSPLRRTILAFKDDEIVASTLALDVRKHRIVTFVIGSTYAAVAGSLYAHWQTFLSTDGFGLDTGTGIFLMVVLGGLRWKWGAILGAAFYVFVPQWLNVTVQYTSILYGALLVVIMMVCPDGLLGLVRTGVERLAPHLPSGNARIAGSPDTAASFKG